MKKYLYNILLSAFILLIFINSSLAQDVKSVSSVSKKDVECYKTAQKKLGKDLYLIYRTAERIIRANNLNNEPWSFEIPYFKDYEVNASASNLNLVTIEAGALNTFSDDVSTLAFLIGHELAHHLNKDIAHNSKINTLELDELNKQIKELNEKIKEHNNKLITYGKYYAIKQALSPEENLEDKLKELKNKKEQLMLDAKSRSRKQEYAADRKSIYLITQAGFDNTQALKALKLFKRAPQSLQDNSSHPNDQNRIWEAEKIINEINVDKLKAVGELNIKNTTPLAYEKIVHTKNYTVSKKTLIIHSSAGSYKKLNEPFEKMFGY